MSTILNEDNTNCTIIKILLWSVSRSYYGHYQDLTMVSIKILLWSVSRSYYGQYQDIVLTVIFKVDL
jgi:hypothetical protein